MDSLIKKIIDMDLYMYLQKFDDKICNNIYCLTKILTVTMKSMTFHTFAIAIPIV